MEGDLPIPKKKDSTVLQAKKLLIKARLYKFVAVLLALMGVVIFVYQYMQHIDGQLLEVMASPRPVLILLLPFLPSAILSWISIRCSRKAYAIMKEDVVSEPSPEVGT